MMMINGKILTNVRIVFILLPCLLERTCISIKSKITATATSFAAASPFIGNGCIFWAANATTPIPAVICSKVAHPAKTLTFSILHVSHIHNDCHLPDMQLQVLHRSDSAVNDQSAYRELARIVYSAEPDAPATR